MFDLDSAIRKVPNFPKPGILFYDLTSLLTQPEAFAITVDELSGAASRLRPTAVAGVEARGFLFAAPVALRLGLPLVLIRKRGKLPGKTVSRSFALEYGSDTIEVHEADMPKGGRVVLVDDLVATGGTLRAAADLFTAGGCTVAGVVAVIGLPFLKFRQVLGDLPVTTLHDYQGE